MKHKETYFTEPAKHFNFYDHGFTATVSDLRDLLGVPQWEENTEAEGIKFQWLRDYNGHLFLITSFEEAGAYDENDLHLFAIEAEHKSVAKKAFADIMRCYATMLVVKRDEKRMYDLDPNNY